MRRDVVVRKPFDFLPAIVWALAIDAIDFVAGIFTLLLTVIGVGVVLDWVVDIIQGILALILFEDSQIAIYGTGVDLVPIPLWDFLPTFTAVVLAKQWGLIK